MLIRPNPFSPPTDQIGLIAWFTMDAPPNAADPGPLGFGGLSLTNLSVNAFTGGFGRPGPGNAQAGAWVFASSPATNVRISLLYPLGGSPIVPFTFAVTCYATALGSFPLLMSFGSLVYLGQAVGTSTGINLYINGGETKNSSTLFNLNTWYRIVGTYNGNTTSGVHCYVNGVDVSNGQNGTVGTVAQTSAAQISGGVGGNSPWQGYMRDVRIWLRALSPAEVLTDYQQRMGYQRIPLTETIATMWQGPVPSDVAGFVANEW